MATTHDHLAQNPQAEEKRARRRPQITAGGRPLQVALEGDDLAGQGGRIAQGTERQPADAADLLHEHRTAAGGPGA